MATSNMPFKRDVFICGFVTLAIYVLLFQTRINVPEYAGYAILAVALTLMLGSAFNLSAKMTGKMAPWGPVIDFSGPAAFTGILLWYLVSSSQPHNLYAEVELSDVPNARKITTPELYTGVRNHVFTKKSDVGFSLYIPTDFLSQQMKLSISDFSRIGAVTPGESLALQCQGVTEGTEKLYVIKKENADYYKDKAYCAYDIPFGSRAR